MDNKVVVTRSIVAVMIGVLLASCFVGAAGQLSTNNSATGNVGNTIFSDLLDRGISPAFDMEPMVVNDPTFRIDSTFWQLPIMDFLEAEKQATEFLQHNVGDNALVGANVTWSALVRPRPVWSLLIEGPNITTRVRVNAISGGVIGWRLAFIQTYSFVQPTDDNDSINATAATQIAHTFLKDNNYSVSSDAYYRGTCQFANNSENPLDWFILFEHRIGDILVGKSPFYPLWAPAEGIGLRIDSKTGRVMEFWYEWMQISRAHFTHLISEEEAQSTALANYDKASNSTVVGRHLELNQVYNLTSRDGTAQIRLFWCIVLKVPLGGQYFDAQPGYLCYLLVDALSGQFLAVEPTNSMVSPPEMHLYTSFNAYSIVVAALLSATMIAFVVRWRVYNDISDDGKAV